MKAGADGVQMGTRFLAQKRAAQPRHTRTPLLPLRTKISSLPLILDHPAAFPSGSSSSLPCMFLPFQNCVKPKCDKGYVLQKDSEGKYSLCPAKVSNEHHFCICNGLLSSANYRRRQGRTSLYRRDQMLHGWIRSSAFRT